jgi:alpha-galactosidase
MSRAFHYATESRTPTSRMVHLQHGGVSVVIDVRSGEDPSVVHWGRGLNEADPVGIFDAVDGAAAHSTSDLPAHVSLIPQESLRFLGRPGLVGSRADAHWSPSFTLQDSEWNADAARFVLTDPIAELRIESKLQLDASGLLCVSHQLTNIGPTDYTLHELGVSLPVPARALERLDLAGRWSYERQPQRARIGTGTWLRELRHGRTGFDSPLALIEGTPGFSNQTGEIWGIHFGWSGNSNLWGERTPEGHQSLGASELLGPAGMTLAPGESYETPTLYASWSDSGLDGMAHRFHNYLRGRKTHPSSARPVTFNSWEAVYFDQTPRGIARLANVAHAYGAERFVLDDGWFLGRRTDHSGLGDWTIDPDVWPAGLEPTVKHITGLGMQFGIWVEPEMVNPDSNLYRAHPDWILTVPARKEPALWRNQYVLDVANPDVFSYLLGALDNLLSTLAISFVKWDHNRDLIDAAAPDGQHRTHQQTLAVYALIDEIRRRHPTVEVESCSSGGGRVDLGILARTDRVWASDSNDAVDRLAIQRWTSLLLPPELVGSHIGPPTAHITGRTQSLAFRFAVALLGSLGIEWDLSTATANETAGLDEGIGLYKRFRGLIHTGALFHADLADPGTALQGVVSADKSEALYEYLQVTTAQFAMPGPTPLPGLDPLATYRIEYLHIPGAPPFANRAAPAWLGEEGVTISGSVLGTIGLSLPGLRPEQAVLVHLIKVPEVGASSHQ